LRGFRQQVFAVARNKDLLPFASHPRAKVLARVNRMRVLASGKRTKPVDQATTLKSHPSKAEGSGAPKGACVSGRALRGAAARSLSPPSPVCEGRVGRGGALTFRRSTVALVAATERFDSAQAVLRAKERTQALSAPSIALKRSTPRAGRHAGGNDARTARERGYKPRPQEPHPLHQSAVTGRRPSMSEHSSVTDNGTPVKCLVTPQDPPAGRGLTVTIWICTAI
jgi:hypothetical protein